MADKNLISFNNPLPHVKLTLPVNDDMLFYENNIWVNKPSTSLPFLPQVTTSGTGIFTYEGTGTISDPLQFASLVADPPLHGDGSSTNHLGFTWPISSQGDLITSDTSSVIQKLSKGNDGQVLTTKSTVPLGLAWDTLPTYAGDGTSLSTTSPFSVIWPLTTKGDLLTFGTDTTRLPIGTDGQLLQADSTQVSGLKWTNNISNNITWVCVYPDGYTGTLSTVVSVPLNSWTTLPVKIDTTLGTAPARYNTSNYNTTTYTWTCPTTGIYLFHASMFINCDASVNFSAAIGFRHNTTDPYNANVAIVQQTIVSGAAGWVYDIQCNSGPIQMVAGDTIIPRVWQNSASTRNFIPRDFSVVQLA